jgi:predicted small integral membrane protein
VASTLASIDLVVLLLVALAVALTYTPVPRVWALAAAALLAVQAFAMHQMEMQPIRPGVEASSGAIVHTTAEAVAALGVPALTSALLAVVFFHCARAYARARRRLADALRKAQAIGSDMPTG